MIRVIVADDEPKVSQLICSLVDWAALDMEIAGVAGNGLEALALVGQHAPQLLITDIRMPGCDGLELVKRAKALQPELEIVIVSGYRHFEYAQTAIQYGVSDYLLKPVDAKELTATLQKMRCKHREKTAQLSHKEQLQQRIETDRTQLRASLFDALEARQSFAGWEEINEKFGYAFGPGMAVQLCLVKLDAEYDKLGKEALDVMVQKMQQAMHDAFVPLCEELEIVCRASAVCAVLGYEEGRARDVRRATRSALDEIRVQNSIFGGAVFTMVLSQPAGSAGELAGAQEQVHTLLEDRVRDGAGGLLQPPAFVGSDEVLRKKLAETRREVEQAAELMDVPALQRALQGFAAAAGADVHASGGQLLALARDLFDDALAALRKAQLPIANATALRAEFGQRLDLCATRTQVMGCLEDSVDAVMQGALAQRQSEGAKPIRLAKQYIHDHYMKPITLEEVSGVAGFNASYFSSLFKKETGQNFLEYLSEVRMNRAKELLRDTDLSVAQICEQVGYMDLKYFTKSFKKVAGLKPGEFRKLYS